MFLAAERVVRNRGDFDRFGEVVIVISRGGAGSERNGEMNRDADGWIGTVDAIAACTSVLLRGASATHATMQSSR